MSRLLCTIGLFIYILLLPFVMLSIRACVGDSKTNHTISPILETPVVEFPEASEPMDEPESYYTYTEDELDLLARLVYSESGGESYETKLRVASVVLNRVIHSDFPNTIYEVIYQNKQFAVTTHKLNGTVMIDRPADGESYLAAKEILDYGSILPDSVLVFYAVYCDEPWVTSREVYEVCDNTVFAHLHSNGG